jgi:hypothetical protein
MGIMHLRPALILVRSEESKNRRDDRHALAGSIEPGAVSCSPVGELSRVAIADAGVYPVAR